MVPQTAAVVDRRTDFHPIVTTLVSEGSQLAPALVRADEINPAIPIKINQTEVPANLDVERRD